MAACCKICNVTVHMSMQNCSMDSTSCSQDWKGPGLEVTVPDLPLSSLGSLRKAKTLCQEVLSAVCLHLLAHGLKLRKGEQKLQSLQEKLNERKIERERERERVLSVSSLALLFLLAIW